MKTKTGVAVGGVWQEDGNTPSSQGQSLANSEQFFIRAVSRTAQKHAFVPRRGTAASRVGGCLGQEEMPPWREGKTPKSLRYWGAGQWRGPCWWGKGQCIEKRRGAGGVQCDTSVAVAWSCPKGSWGQEMSMPEPVWCGGGFDFWGVQSIGTSSKTLGWVHTNGMYLQAYSKVYTQPFPEGVLQDLRVEPVLHWSCQQAVY